MRGCGAAVDDEDAKTMERRMDLGLAARTAEGLPSGWVEG